MTVFQHMSYTCHNITQKNHHGKWLGFQLYLTLSANRLILLSLANAKQNLQITSYHTDVSFFCSFAADMKLHQAQIS